MIEVVLANRYYLGDLLEEATLADSLAEIAYRGEITLVVTPDLPVIAPGQEIRISGPHPVSGNMVVLLDGVVWTVESRTRGQKHVTVTVYDRTIYLDRSEDEYLFPAGQTATARLKRYTADWSIPLGRVVDTGVALGKAVYRAQTIFNMLWTDLKETARQGGLYRARMAGKQLELVRLGSNSTVWQLETFEEVAQSRTLEGAVTKVKVLGAAIEDTKSSVMAVETGETKLGTLQRVIQDEQITTQGMAKAAAKALLTGIQETVTVTGPDIPTIRAGDKVTLNGASWLVTTAQHSLGDPGHMTLDLASEQYIRRRYYA
ncbi:MAG: phage portal protein [Firmicutes bacterium]|nr:phage portal protein [Bacillota bacterium]